MTRSVPRLMWILLALVSVSLVLAACDPGEDVDVGETDEEDDLLDPDEDDPDDPDDPDDAEDEEPPEDGDVAEGNELIAAIASEPDQLDPHATTAYAAFQVLENVFDTLVQPDAEGEFEPALASEWSADDEGTLWTFELRDDVSWHDGSDFTADDVVYSIERIADEGQNAFRFADLEQVEATDDHTVEFTLAQPAPNLLANVGGFKGMAIIPEGSGDDIANEPVGTGPYRFVEFNEGSDIVLEANPDYWGGAPDIDGVEFRFISEGAVRMTALQTGEVDWTADVPAQDVDAVLDDDDLEAESTASNDYYYYALNQTREPFDDPQVREALAYGFDRGAVADAAEFGNAVPAQTPIPEGDFYATDYAPYEHDPAQAEALLDEAGVDDLSIDLMVNSDDEETVRAAEVLEAQWADIGVDVTIRPEETGTWLDEQGEGNFDAFLWAWIGNLDPFDYYFAQHLSDGASNFHGFADDEVDEALMAGQATTDEDERREAYVTAAERIVDLNSYTYLYQPQRVHAWQPVVSGYETRFDGAIRFEDVSLDR